MPQLKTTMDIFKLLDQSNCRDCGEKTCLAFAAAVFKGKRQLGECTHLDPKLIERYTGQTPKAQSVEEDMADEVARLKDRVAGMDLSAAAKRLGAKYSEKNESLTLKIFGKDFTVDRRGRLFTDLHVNAWMVIPVFNHVISGKGAAPTGKWVPFRELHHGRERNLIYLQRVERPLKRVADNYTNFFKDLLEIFDGREMTDLFDSDVSIVLHPLPLIPILICYDRPDEGIASDLHIFFDETAESNMDIDSLYIMVGGIVNMFNKIAARHGVRDEPA